MMDTKYLAEIKARTEEAVEDGIGLQQLDDLERMIAEVERLTEARDYLQVLYDKLNERDKNRSKHITTLKKALELAIGNHTAKREQIERLADYFIKQAQEQEGEEMKPILFNTEMVRAILDGRKTTTRRVIKYRGKTPPECGRDKFYTYVQELNGKPFNGAGFYKDSDIFIVDGAQHTDANYFKTPYVPGDILYVRETWSKDKSGEFVYRTNYGKTEDDSFHPSMFKWHPSIHMPKAIARIFLRVTDVRAERLQNITEDGAEKEGCGIRFKTGGWERNPLNQFCVVWNSTIKKSDIDRYGWNANPWVWVIEFERTANPDA